ncbi:MAG TPA: hypothetical protein VJL89_00135, partial [Thermodesulfovibrionia bacterium]|nr:hypothetical protein [Thermodesulfovibrionia bacterium]
IWMKCWQAVYCRQIFGFLSGKNTHVWTARSIVRLVLVQAVIQPSALLVLPVALVMTIPFSWVFAFYFNVSVLGAGQESSPGKVIRQAARQAMLWPVQNHILISVLFLFGFFVFVNLGITVYMIPHLLKDILGFETVFTKSGISMLNSTFFAAVCSLCYLFMTPLISAVYTLRCFYGASVRSGADLIGQLRTAFDAEKIVSAVLILMLFVPVSGYAQIQTQSYQTSVSSEELERQIVKEMNKPEYAWRQEVKEAEEEDKGIIEKFFAGIIDFISEAIDIVYDWIKKFFEWLDDVMPKQESKGRKSVFHGSRSYYLYTLIFIVAAVGMFFLWRFISAKKSAVVDTSGNSEAAPAPELTDNYVTADQLTSDKWIELAQEMAAKGELRLALRAVYLSTLAMLGQYGLVTIARFKSNRDYEHELARRIRSAQPLSDLFSFHVAEFNQSWYGTHPVTNARLDQFIENHKRIAAIAAK